MNAAALDAVPKRLYIGGAWRDGARGSFAVEDPASGIELCRAADASPADALSALDAACAAAPAFAALSPRERSDILRHAYEAVLAQRERLATLITLEMGKSVRESLGEVDYAAEFLRWFAGEAERIDGRFAVAPDGRSRLLTMRQPVGPCLLITPWNFPLAMGTRKIAPAIAAGCTMVVKPAEQTPLTMLALASILSEAGLPGGVLNVITTTDAAGAVAPLMADPRLRKLSFTGSTAVGKRLMAQASGGLLRLSLELGGNAPFLVFEDADLDAALDGAMEAKLRNIGEACTAANRFLVADAVADEFAARLAERMRALRVGAGLDPAVDIGPLIDGRQRDKVTGLVDDALARGARTLAGGHAIDGDGYFYAPTVLLDVAGDAALLREEIFGPVAPIQRFASEAEAVAAANASEYGLAAYVYTQDLKRALRVSEALESGMVALNRGIISNAQAPFGGVKQSGFGREGGREGIDEYLALKYVALAP